MNRKFSTIKNEKGQGLVEYALLSALVGLVAISALMAFGPEIKVMATGLIGSFSGGYSVEDGELIPPSPIASSTPIATSTPIASSSPIASPTSTSTASPIPTASLPPSATPVLPWTNCANENGVCSFSGTALVRYGANDIWVTQTHTNGVSCTNAVFGDPISGVAKTCQIYQIASSTPIPLPTPTALACTLGNATVANESACSALSSSNNCQNYTFRRWNGKCTWY